MARKAKKKRALNHRTPVANKTAKVVAMMQRAGGVTRAEVLKVTGWKAVSMQQVAKSAGVKLRVDHKERPFHYRAAK